MERLYRDLDYVEMRVLEIETELTAIHLKYSDLIPKDKFDFLRIDDLRKEIEDVTGGENTIRFNPRGQAEPMYVFRMDGDNAYFSSWEDELTGGDTYAVLPNWIRNGHTRRTMLVNKYKCGAIYANGSNSTHTNHALGLYGLSPAHSSGGFTVSESGVLGEMDDLNAATLPADFPSALTEYVMKKHCITWDEYGFICLMAKRYGWEPTGNITYGKDSAGRKGEPADYLYNNRYPHTRVGTGPRQWRHNGKVTGIADLCGLLYTIVSGARVSSGVIQLVDFTSGSGNLSAAEIGVSGTLYKAISAPDGAYIDPSTIGTTSGEGDSATTVKAYSIDLSAVPTASGQNLSLISDEINIRDGGYYTTSSHASQAIKEGLSSHWKLELAGYMPFANGGLGGTHYFRNTDGSVFAELVGGDWSNSLGRLRLLYGSYGFSSTGYPIGALLASS